MLEFALPADAGAICGHLRFSHGKSIRNRLKVNDICQARFAYELGETAQWNEFTENLTGSRLFT